MSENQAVVISESQGLEEQFQKIKLEFQREKGIPLKERKKILKQLKKSIQKKEKDIIEAIASDFGGRSRFETLSAEVFMVVEGIKHTLVHLDDWVYDRERETSWVFWPGNVEVCYQPLGVVGVISPWNYPFQLAMLPIAEAIAAGNYIMLKPSEFTPKTAKIMKEILFEVMGDKAVVVEGDASVGAAFSSLPFDHLFFTGSTHVGRLVMRAAAEHLTPVTLELGGKSPVIIHESFPLKRAADRIVFGKLYNAGQTCIAPDYVLCPKGKSGELVSELQKAIAKYYPSLENNDDYTSVINDRRVETLEKLLEDAKEKGAEITTVNPDNETLKRAFPPTIVTKVNDEMLIMQEEIFGPLLPIVEVEDLEHAIQYVNDRPRPLALYYFDWKKKRCQQILEQTHSGGITFNDTLLHVSQHNIGFGGVGPSGMGRYHGRDGFETFSNKKGVFAQKRLNLVNSLTRPPYPKWAYSLLRLFMKI